MNMNIKTTIGIIAIAMSSLSMAEAGERYERKSQRLNDGAHSRNYEKPRQNRHFRNKSQRKQWKHANRRHDNFRSERRHARKHHYYNRHDRYNRKLKRMHKKHSGWKRGWRHERRHNNKHNYNRSYYRHSTYVAPRYIPSYISPSHSSHTVISRGHGGDVLPVLAGGLIGSAIASDVSCGDPGAAFGGAIFCAIVCNALANH